ncbi:hypothetical protein PC110_g12778 [Phytophthora cactorum]|uniref:Uncharacterized protein n=1 Tax=Phytophthora cactorum TaxID=29920 RepID=A0A329S4Q1_9STRA|nr:hypothetical protein PC110_g12778 [Phytophthora cactorum]
MAPARRVLKVQVDDSGTESGSEESDSDLDCHHRICLATGEGHAGDREAYRSRDHQDAADPVRCLSANHGRTQSPDVGDI